MIRCHEEEITDCIPGTIVYLVTVGRENRRFIDLDRYEEVYPVICGTQMKAKGGFQSNSSTRNTTHTTREHRSSWSTRG